MLRDAQLKDSLYKNPDMCSHQADEHDKTLKETAATDQPKDVDLEPPRDDLGSTVGEGFMGMLLRLFYIQIYMHPICIQ